MSDPRARKLARLVEEIIDAIRDGVCLNRTHHCPQIAIAQLATWTQEKERILAAPDQDPGPR